MNCGSCKFFHAGDDSNSACRYNPPTALVLTEYRQPVRASEAHIMSPQPACPPVAVQSIPVSLWPHVTAEHWCGKWQPREVQ
jgi:hypothetical protein